MWLALLVACAPVQDAPSAARLHPADCALFLEIPDAARVLESYSHAPWAQMVRDEAAQKSASAVVSALGFDADRALERAKTELGFPERARSITLDDALASMRAVHALSLSIGLSESTPGELARDAATMAACRNAIGELSSELDTFAVKHDARYPAQLSELERADAFAHDAWGRAYVYKVADDRTSAEVASLGADGKVGGTGVDSDVDAKFRLESWMAGELERRLRVEVCAEFATEQHATAALGELAKITLSDEDAKTDSPVTLAGASARLARFRMPYGSHPRAWTIAAGARVVLGIGAIDALDVARRFDGGGASLADSPELARLRKSLAPAKAPTVVSGYANFASLTSAFPQLAKLMNSGAGSYFAMFGSSLESIAWRMQLDGERFVTEAVTTHAARSTSWFDAIASKPVSPELARSVPDDAIGVFVASIDGQALHDRMIALMGLDSAQGSDSALAQIEAKHDFNLKRDVFDSLGNGVAAYLLPITAVTSLPGATIVIDLKDPAAFERGLKGLLATLEEQPDNTFHIKFKKYREAPMWTFTFGEEDAKPSTGGGGLTGGLSQMLAVSPTIAIAKNRAIVTLTSVRAIKEIKRALGEEPAAQHPMLGLIKPPADATAIGYMDWPNFFDGLFGAARGGLALAGGFAGGELPIDVNKLGAAMTDPKVYSRFFKPTFLWMKAVDGGTYVRNESSFGPEAWLHLFAIGASAYYSFDELTTRKPPAPASEPAAAAPPDASVEQTRGSLRYLATRIAVFQLEQEKLPAKLDDLLAPTPNYPKGFVDGGKLPSDAWQHAFEYRVTDAGAHYRLWSIGPDGVDADGSGDDLLAP